MTTDHTGAPGYRMSRCSSKLSSPTPAGWSGRSFGRLTCQPPPEYPRGPDSPGKLTVQILTAVTPVELDDGSFLVEYRSKEGAALLCVGAYRLKERPVGTETLYEIRGGLRATLVEGNGEVWLWWSEPGRWQPKGAGGEAPPAVDHPVYARGIPGDVAAKDVAMGVAEALVALDGPWVYARGRLPPEVLVLRPTWLPPGYREAPIPVSAGVGSLGPFYEVSYTAGRDLNIFLRSGLCDVGVAERFAIERVKMRGVEVFIFRNQEADYRLSACWTEAGRSYSIWTSGGVSRDDLVRIVAGLRPVGMDELEAGPGQLPRSGGTVAPLPVVAAVGAGLGAMGLLLGVRARGPRQ